MLTCNYLFTSSILMSKSTIVLNPTLPDHFNLPVFVGFILLHVALISSNTMLNKVADKYITPQYYHIISGYTGHINIQVTNVLTM